MAKLNRNNFLIWDGAFDGVQVSVIANDDSVQGEYSSTGIVIFPLQNDFATFGIDIGSFTVIAHDNPTKPPVWSIVSQSLTYFPPEDVTGTHVLSYRFRDLNGNLSNIGTITINVTARQTYWKEFPSSFRCEQGPDGNTGMVIYDELQEFYISTDDPVTPVSLKPNVPEDPDYVAPVQNLSECPITSPTATYYIYNNTDVQTSNALITNISFFRIDNTLLETIPLNLQINESKEIQGPKENVNIVLEVGPLEGGSAGATTYHEVVLNSETHVSGNNQHATYLFLDPELMDVNFLTLISVNQ